MFRDLWDLHRGKCIGVLAGLFLGFIYLFFGFWDMLIFAFIVVIGYYVGKRIDQREGLDLEGFRRWLSERWRMFR